MRSLPMTRIFRDADATLEPLVGKTIAVIGYGTQGRSQALNLRDSGERVIVGNAPDAYAAQAREDGFECLSIADATARADVVLCLIPDELTPAIYESAIRPVLRAGNTLSFASCYCVAFKEVEVSPDVDVLMFTPRTIGHRVRASLLS